MRRRITVKMLMEKAGLRQSSSTLFARLLYVALSLIVICGILSYFVDQGAYFYAVYVDGQEVGLLAQRDELQEIRDTLQLEALLFYGRPVHVAEDIKYAEVYRPLAKEDPDKVLSQLRNTLSYKVDALMVTVGGQDLLPVADDAAVEQIVEIVTNAYIPAKDNVSLERVYLVEQIDSRPCLSFPEELRDPETIAAILLRGTDRREIYLVSRGDSLWQIARENDISVAELREANPQVDGDKLQIGDKLSLVVPEPLVNVITVERVTVTERIPFQTVYVPDDSMWSGQTAVLERGVFGNRDVVYEVTRENGRESAREIISSAVTSEPVDQKVARGTASIPSRGTGSFIWPVQGGGRLTSPFGWRNGGFHAGIDIAAPRGTPILAADSGVVVFVSWDGGYGKCIVVYHGRYYTRYAHNSQNLVSRGEAVAKGDVIGRIGATGRAFGDHVHFEIRTGGIYGPPQDPLKFYRP